MADAAGVGLYGGTLLVTARPIDADVRAVGADLACARRVLADEQLLGVTDPVALDRIHALVIPPAWSEVWIALELSS